ncbi:GAF domain-containing protein [bacterium]|nr:GAF domain-containing protein [bacterium]
MASVPAALDARLNQTNTAGAALDWSRAELRMLAELSEAFTDSIDLEHTLVEAVHKIAEHMQAQAASLFLLDSAGDLVCRASAGPVNVVGLKVRHGHGIVGRTVANNQVQLIEDVQHDPDYIASGVRVKGFAPRTMVCAPLSTRQGAMGALQVINKLTGEAVQRAGMTDILRVLCVPTTLALSNARLAQDLLQQNRIRREFELARQMQKRCCPSAAPAFQCRQSISPHTKFRVISTTTLRCLMAVSGSSWATSPARGWMRHC